MVYLAIKMVDLSKLLVITRWKYQWYPALRFLICPDWLNWLVAPSMGSSSKNSMSHLGQCYDAWRCSGPAQTVTEKQLQTTDVCHLLYGFKMFHLLLLSIMKHHKTSLFGHISIVKHLGNHWAHPDFDVRRRRGQQQRRRPRDVTN